MSELYLVRHAQASFGTDNYDQLSQLGYRQANLLGEYLKSREIVFDHIFTGSLNRQRQTVEGMMETHPELARASSVEMPGLNEYQFIELNQAYAKRNADDDLVIKIAQSRADKRDFFRLLRRVLQSWSKDELKNVSESFDDFRNRINEATTIIRKQTSGSEKVLAISSGGVISQFIGNLLEIPAEQSIELNLQTRNASISRFHYNDSTIKLSSFNATPHLETTSTDDLITYG